MAQKRIAKPKPRPPRRQEYSDERTFEDSRTKRARTRNAQLRKALSEETKAIDSALTERYR